LNILRDIEDKGWQLIAIYHSHPANEAYPSRTDVSLAYYPDAVYIIVSLAGEDPPPVRAFRIVDGNIREIGLVIDQETERRETAPKS
jgi:[CysO sulfur-carrier protein]-S-L-cysteine hydrolase